MLLSVIIPVYNVENYLDKCIQSVLEQSFKDMEIILINDGSNDTSGEICDRYRNYDNRIKVIHKKNGGLSDARNKGIDLAKGEYITFLDSDDWIRKDTYEILYNLAIRANADIVHSDFIRVFDEDIIPSTQCDIKFKEYTGDEMINNFYDKSSGEKTISWNKIYKRKLFNIVRFPVGKLHEDEFTSYKIYHQAEKVIYVQEPLYFYRQREGSIMSQGFSEKRLHVLEAWKERREYFREQGLNELVRKTESNLCGILKAFYVQVKKSNLENKKEILQALKKDMQKDYIKFIKNPYITDRGKITLTICLLNGPVFCELYDRYTQKDERF